MSVIVPMVERGLLWRVFCSIEITGGSPYTKSTSGFATEPNMRLLWTYLGAAWPAGGLLHRQGQSVSHGAEGAARPETTATRRARTFAADADWACIAGIGHRFGSRHIPHRPRDESNGASARNAGPQPPGDLRALCIRRPLLQSFTKADLSSKTKSPRAGCIGPGWTGGLAPSASEPAPSQRFFGSAPA